MLVICIQSVDSKFVIRLDEITRGYTDKTLISQTYLSMTGQLNDTPLDEPFKSTYRISLEKEFVKESLEFRIKIYKKKKKREIKLSTLKQMRVTNFMKT